MRLAGDDEDGQEFRFGDDDAGANNQFFDHRASLRN